MVIVAATPRYCKSQISLRKTLKCILINFLLVSTGWHSTLFLIAITVLVLS